MKVLQISVVKNLIIYYSIGESRKVTNFAMRLWQKVFGERGSGPTGLPLLLNPLTYRIIFAIYQIRKEECLIDLF
jgi:hypothetical protein